MNACLESQHSSLGLRVQVGFHGKWSESLSIEQWHNTGTWMRKRGCRPRRMVCAVRIDRYLQGWSSVGRRRRMDKSHSVLTVDGAVQGERFDNSLQKG